MNSVGQREGYEEVGKTKNGESIYKELLTGQLYVEKDYRYLVTMTDEEKQGIEKRKDRYE